MRTLRRVLLFSLFCLLLFKLLMQIALPHNWDQPVSVVIYPVNADGQRDTGQYIRALSREHFESIELYLAQQARRYGLPLRQPVSVRLGPVLDEPPPAPPAEGSHAEYLNWSLRIRAWSWWNLPADDGDVRIFIRFFSPVHTPKLAHSIGLEQGRIGVVNGYAAIDLQALNNFVATHELLHTLGASDKYDFETQLPIYPHGYAEPDRQPRFPQSQAEIMGGWIAQSQNYAVMPRGLQDTLIGEETAREIGWR